MRRQEWKWWRTPARATALFCALQSTCSAATNSVLDFTDRVSDENLQPGGNCESGCVRYAADAVARVVGEVDCELRVQNLLDFRDEDVVGGSLNVVHSCTDSNGTLLYQGEGSCLYSICVKAQWEGERASYVIAVQHEAASEERSVRVQAFINEYEDLVSVEEPTENFSCELGDSCSDATGCSSSETLVEVLLEDDFGDGWVGGLPDRANTWSLARDDGTGSVVLNGSLPDIHYSGTTSLCLEPGSYTFSSTADAAWSSESTWSVCGVDGGVGGSLDFAVEGGACDVVDDSNASGPPSTDVETDSNDYCSLPEASPCVGMDVDNSTTVGFYYDQTCLKGGGGDTGCGGGGIPACRLCFVNRDEWATENPLERVPDWVDCPCCVADTLGVTCHFGESEALSSASSPSLWEEARDSYVEGKTPVVAGIGGLLGICWVFGCCCCVSIANDKRKALTYKKRRASISDYSNGEVTSPEDSPPFGGHRHSRSSSAGKTPSNVAVVAQESRATPLTYNAAAAATHHKHERADERARRSDQRGLEASRPLPSAPVDGSDGLAERTSGYPPLGVGVSPRKLPGAAKGRPPSDASWPSDPRVGVSIDGKKNPRWSGSKELRAYLRRTGYDKMSALEVEADGPAPEEQQKRKQEQRHKSGGSGHRVVQALRKSGSGKPSEMGHSDKFDWVDDGSGRGNAADDVSPGIALGDLPVAPPPPPPDTAPAPARVTAVPPRASRSRSRSRSRRSMNEGMDVDVSDASPEHTRRRSRSRSGSKASWRAGRPRSLRSVVPSDDADMEDVESMPPKPEPERQENRTGPVDHEADELGVADATWLDKNWNAAVSGVPRPPEVAAPSLDALVGHEPARRESGGDGGRGGRRGSPSYGPARRHNQHRSRELSANEAAAAAASEEEADGKPPRRASTELARPEDAVGREQSSRPPTYEDLARGGRGEGAEQERPRRRRSRELAPLGNRERGRDEAVAQLDEHTKDHRGHRRDASAGRREQPPGDGRHFDAPADDGRRGNPGPRSSTAERYAGEFQGSEANEKVVRDRDRTASRENDARGRLRQRTAHAPMTNGNYGEGVEVNGVHASRSTSRPRGDGPETVAEQRRRRAREEQEREKLQRGEEKGRPDARRSGNRSRDRLDQPRRPQRQSQASDPRSEGCKSGGHSHPLRPLVDETTSRKHLRNAGGGSHRADVSPPVENSERHVGSEALVMRGDEAAVDTGVSKKKSGAMMRFSNDPRARQARAVQRREKQEANIQGREEQ